MGYWLSIDTPKVVEKSFEEVYLTHNEGSYAERANK